MFFYLSKIFWLLAKPLNLIALGTLTGFILRQWKRGLGNKILLFFGSLFLIFGFLPIGHNMLVFLERQYDRPTPMPERVDGILVLGGAFNTTLSVETGMILANSNINRMIDFADLAQKYPDARLIFSGGSGNMLNPEHKEADEALRFMEMVGADSARVMFEENARNSYENIIYSRKFAAPLPQEKWIIITSDFHMPRVMSICAKQQWDVIPYPSSPKTNGQYRFNPLPLNIIGNFSKLHTATKEFIGSASYYFSGKSAFLLPLSSIKSPHKEIQNQSKTGQNNANK